MTAAQAVIWNTIAASKAKHQIEQLMLFQQELTMMARECGDSVTAEGFMHAAHLLSRAKMTIERAMEDHTNWSKAQ
jgi:hypothetical protein